MSSILRLSTSYFHCPPCWRNFIGHIINGEYDSYIHESGRDVPDEVINSALKKYKAMYIEKAATTPLILFDDERLKTLFILEWS